MPRYIDAELLERHKVKGEMNSLSGDFVSGFDIDHTPTADVVEVVRCKDCKHGKLFNGDTEVNCDLMCVYLRTDDFCSYGERKEKEDGEIH